MSVVKAKIQTVEEMYRLIWTAIANRQPIRAIYKDLPRLFCPHRLGRHRLGQPRVLCYQHGGESESGLGPVRSPENWRCVVFEKLRRVERLDGCWKTAPNHSRPATCVVEADSDAEDQPERDPQKGHGAIPLNRCRAKTILKVVIERGLCRSGRTRGATRPEAWRRLGRW
jgi:hypothetical protein